MFASVLTVEVTHFVSDALLDRPDPITVMSTESINSFANIAQKPFSKEVADILLAPVNENDVEIKPDGEEFVLAF